jgi:hypothetical protein
VSAVGQDRDLDSDLDPDEDQDAESDVDLGSDQDQDADLGADQGVGPDEVRRDLRNNCHSKLGQASIDELNQRHICQ